MNPVFFVDGKSEKEVLARVCPGVPAKLTGLNGDVDLEAIANRISDLFPALGNRYYPLIVVIDRERRSETSLDIESELRELLAKKLEDQGVNLNDIIVGVSDRNLESWVIAALDIEEDSFDSGNSDITNVYSVMRKYVPKYRKATDAPDIITWSSLPRMYRRSPSFKRFADNIARIECSALSFISSLPAGSRA